MPSRNTADTSIPYQLLMNIIEGSITPFVKFDTPKRHRSFLKQIIRLIAIGVAVFLAGPTGGLSLEIAASNALGFAAAGIGELIITGVVAGLIDAAEQGLLIGLGVIQKFSFTEVLCAGFAAATPGIIGNNKGLEATLRLGASNVSEQLTLMALGKQNHIDLIQVSAALLGATLDSQISKLTNPQDPILKTIQKTLSSAAINAGIKGKFDLELVAAQLISNSVLTLVEPKLIQAKTWANEKVFHPDNPKQLSQPMKTPTKSLAKHHANASKENVGLAEVIHTKKAMNPESFMKKMGIDEVMEDYQKAKSEFSFEEEHYESVIAPIKNLQPNKIQTSSNGFWDYLRGFNHGVEAGRDAVVQMVKHPLDTASGLIVTSFDGYNAIADSIFGISTQSSKERNSARGFIINDGILKFQNGSGATKFEMGTSVVAGAIITGGLTSTVRSPFLLTKKFIKFADNAKIKIVKVGESGLFKSKIKNQYGHIIIEQEKNYKFKLGEDIAHFNKHYNEFKKVFDFKNYSIQDYINDANSVIKNGTYVPELNAYISIAGGAGKAKGLIVGLDRSTKEITTFHLKPVSYIEQYVPSIKWNAQSKSELTDLIGQNRESGWVSPYR